MIWKIAKKELLLNLMTFKFAVGTILCVVLMTVFMPVLVKDYQQRLKDYSANVARNEAKLRKVKVYKNITPTVYKPPAVLSVFSEGLEKRLGNSARIEFESVPEINMALSEDNPFLSIFPAMDVSLIFKIVVSILALLVAYDTISGEREQGTLKLVMSNSLPRYQVLLGKLLAGLVTLVVPITMAFIIGVLILEFSPTVDLAESTWARIGQIYVTSLVFISAMYNFGILFSCLTKKSAISLMLVLLSWVIFVLIIPNASIRLATQIRPLESREVVDGRIMSIREQFANEHGELIHNLWNVHKMNYGTRVVSGGTGAFGRGYAKMISKSYLEERLKRQAFSLKMRYADQVWKVELDYLSSLLNQKRFANNLSRVSPISLYGNVIASISGSDLASFQYFIDRAETYRNQVIEYIRRKTDNFASASTITACSEEDMVECERRYAQYKHAKNEDDKKKAHNAWRKWADKKIKDQPSLDLQDLPRFIYRPAVLVALQRAILDLGLLIFIDVLFFVLSFVAFVRYDVRSD